MLKYSKITAYKLIAPQIKSYNWASIFSTDSDTVYELVKTDIWSQLPML